MKPENTQYYSKGPSTPGHTPVHRRVGDSGREVALDKRTDLRNHSTDGFSWGGPGSGPAQLALAILADFYESDQAALECYRDFAAESVATYGEEAPFFVTGAEIVDICGEP